MNEEQKQRLVRLYNLANDVQNQPEKTEWALQIKSALSYILHGDERYEVMLQHEENLKNK